MYSISFNRLRDQNMPYLLRKPVLQQIISCTIKPIVDAHRVFRNFKIATDIRLAHNGQVYLLRKILNDTFDPYGRRITIVDAIIPNDSYVPNRENIKQSYIASSASGTKQFYIAQPPQYFGEFDFIVNCPIFLKSKTILIYKMIDEYKQAGKKYTLRFE